MGKYDPLRNHLASSVAAEVAMTFAETEEQVGPLPSSARTRRSWWTSEGIDSRPWLAAGWRVWSVDQKAEHVFFRRDPAVRSRTGDRRTTNAESLASTSVEPPGTSAGAHPAGTPRKRLRVPVLLAAVVSATGTAAITVAGVTAMPRWALFLISFDISLVVIAITSAVTEQRHRVAALWISNGLLVALLAGITIYNLVPVQASVINVAAKTDVTLSNLAGGPPDSTNPYATVLSAGVSDTATCYTIVRGRIWLYFDFSNVDYGWAPFSKFSYAPGFPHHLPPSCS
jgi:hypothetical protein